MLFGGLEIVAAGVVVHEYNKNKKEKRELQRIQQEEEDYRRAEEERRRRRRRHSASDQRPPRPSKQDDYKYGNKPASGPSQGSYPAKPAAAVAGLYGATSPAFAPPNGKYNYVGPSSSNLNVPAGPMRPSSAPGVQRYDQRPGGPPAYAPPYNNPAVPQQAPYYGPALSSHYGPPRPQAQTNYAPPPPHQPVLVPYIPGQYQNHAQQQPPQSQNQGPWAPDEKYPLPPLEQDPRRRSDTSLPLGIYEEPAAHNYAVPPPGTFEMSAEGPWMNDDHRTAHQSPHVRFRLPGEGRVVGTGDRASVAMTATPPPAYRP